MQPSVSTLEFPNRFVWGAATSSYQIEGGASGDGRGDSVWDMLCRQPGRVRNGHNGDIACDHVRRSRDDIACMQEIGLQAYRFSVAWPRVLPQGTGPINQQGLDFYDRLVDDLLAAGIAPWLTLFHWDFPYTLFLRGGWLNPESPEWFAAYAATVVDRLSDRVRHWITLNEPQCFIWYGHSTGMHAPGLQYGLTETALAGHHVLLAHGRAAQVIRSRAKTVPTVGLASVGIIRFPATAAVLDVEAARRATFEMNQPTLWGNTWWMDPLFHGSYPADGLQALGAAAPKFTEAEMATINQPLDFLGLNIYDGVPVHAGDDGKPSIDPLPLGNPETHFGWAVVPDVLRWGPRFIHERYGCPLVITENGLSTNDWVARDGAVHDPQRIDFLARYLGALKQACNDGADIRGYFHWSLLDNFEWAEGYKHRFGLVHVDYQTQHRTLKDSAFWYRDLIRAHGANRRGTTSPAVTRDSAAPGI